MTTQPQAKAQRKPPVYTNYTNPPAALLLEKAQEEKAKRLPIEEYRQVIGELVTKTFTVSDIAAWLRDHGAGPYAHGLVRGIVAAIRVEREKQDES